MLNLKKYLFACFLITTGLLNSALQSKEEEQAQTSKTISVELVHRLDVSSSINPATYNYFKENFKRAHTQQVDLILITMNTPGGLVSTTKDILNLFGESDIPVVMWVRPEGASATSAGAILASGAHFLFMSNGTSMGAATPVQMGGDIEQEDARNKAVNDLVALVKSLSEARGRNSEGFEKMISEAKSFSASDAYEQNLINGIANDEGQLWRLLDGMSGKLKGNEIQLEVTQNPKVEVISMDPGQALLNLLANPVTAYVLFLIGAALLYFEMQSPGGMIAGGLGVLFLILAGIGFQVLPLNVGALVLIALAFVLFILEVYITSYGLFSIAGVISLITGSLFLYRTDDSYIELSAPVIFSSVSAIVVFILIVLLVIARDQKNIGKEKFNSFDGLTAKVVAKMDPMHPGHHYYQIKVAGELWQARCKDELSIGDHCIVIAQDSKDNILDIQPFNQTQGA